MLELATGIVLASIAATFFSDIMSRTMKIIRRRQDDAPREVNVAH